MGWQYGLRTLCGREQDAASEAESPAQRRLLIDAKRDLYKVALDYTHYKIEPRVLRAFINRSGDTARWIEEKEIRVNRIAPFYPNQVPLACC